jgi:hypothetical protein
LVQAHQVGNGVQHALGRAQRLRAGFHQGGQGLVPVVEQGVGGTIGDQQQIAVPGFVGLAVGSR